MRTLAIPIWITATVIYLVVAIAWIVKVSKGSPTIEDFSVWIAGVAQPVAVAWFVYAFLLQREELELQRHDLALTRDEMARSSKALQSSDLTAKRASFAPLRAEYQGMLDDLVKPIEKGIPDKYKASGVLMVDAFMYRLYESASNAGTHITASLAQTHCANYDLKSIALNYVHVYEGLLEKSLEADSIEHATANCVDVGIFERRVRSTYHFGWYTMFVVMFDLKDSQRHLVKRADTDFALRHRDKIVLETGEPRRSPPATSSSPSASSSS